MRLVKYLMLFFIVSAIAHATPPAKCLYPVSIVIYDSLGNSNMLSYDDQSWFTKTVQKKNPAVCYDADANIVFQIYRTYGTYYGTENASAPYQINTLDIGKLDKDGNIHKLHRFQHKQKFISAWFDINSNHTFYTLITEAARWVNAGELQNNNFD